ncbi:MAG: hypothetical protein ACRDRR_07930 [Pseudonocardiaceae bacterium]
MIREDRELLAELARVNRDVVPAAMRVMDDSATAEEQRELGDRLIAVGERLRRRGDGMNCAVVEGEVLGDVSLALPAHSVEPPDWKP